MNLPISQLSEADRARLEQLLLDFDQSWTEHHLGVMAGQLDAESPEFKVAALVELVKIDIDYRYREVQPTQIEWYLKWFKELRESPDTLSELLQAEIEVRMIAGEAPSVEDLTQRFPAIHDRIAAILAEAEKGKVRSLALRAKRKAEASESDKASLGSTASIARAAQETLPPTTRNQTTPGEQGDHSLGQFGRYRLVRELGRGAMGTVYLAEDTELRRHVALKRPRIGENEAAAMLQRFYREAYAAATLNHPNICPVYDIGEHEGVPYITMAYVEGKTLSRVIRESRGLNPRAVALLVRKVAVALAEAHGKGVIHRDLKPGNIMLNHRSEPIVMDFGLARQVEHADDRLSVDGMLIGTPGYMSPEQVDGDLEKVGRASDIYSLGVVLFELLTGRLPFQGSVAAVIGKILRDEAPAPSSLRVGLPQQFDEVCLKMMAKSPGDRYVSMTEVAEALGSLSKKLGDEATATAPPPVETISTAQLAAQRQQISQMIQNGQWREASFHLQRMSELQDPISAPYVDWAREQMAALHVRWEQEQASAARLVAEAKEDFARHDYAGAAQRLVKIDKELMTVESQQLLDESFKLAEEVDLLIHMIEQGLNGGSQAGMFRNMQRLLQLKPRDPLVRDLYRKFRWQQRLGWFGATLADAVSLAAGRKRSIHDEPVLRKWLAMAAVVFLISFGLMTWAVMSYLKVDDEVAVRSAETAVAVDELRAEPSEMSESMATEAEATPMTDSSDAPSVTPETQLPENESPVTVPPVVVDVERAAAEWVIKKGGRVGVSGQYINDVADLPAESFQILAVFLENVQSDPGEFSVLAPLAKVNTARLSGAGVTDECLAWMPASRTLKNVLVSDANISDDGLNHIGKVATLLSLSLPGTKISDRGLEELNGLKQLQRLDLSRTSVTSSGVEALKRALPNCEVLWDGPKEPLAYHRPTLPRISQQPLAIMTHGLPLPRAIKAEKVEGDWRATGVFAHIRATGRLHFPQVTVTSFAADIDVRLNSADDRRGAFVVFPGPMFQDPAYGIRIAGNDSPARLINTTFFTRQGRRMGSNKPPLEAGLGELVKLTLLVDGDDQLLYAEGATRPVALHWTAYQPKVHIDVPPGSLDLVIERFLLRSLTEEEKLLISQHSK